MIQEAFVVSKLCERNVLQSQKSYTYNQECCHREPVSGKITQIIAVLNRRLLPTYFNENWRNSFN